MTTQDDPRLLFKQAPIDTWSTREKLALATSVKKSGDQNWSSVSRPLKTFAEQNRPADWFSQKFCALQYNDMLEKIEVPKRKRGERGEETAQDLIIKKMTTQRLEELENIIKDGILDFCNLKKKLDILKDDQYDDKYFKEISSYISQKEKLKADNEIKHKNWLSEREIKISQMRAARGLIYPKQSKIVSNVSTTPEVLSVNEEKNKTTLEKDCVEKELVHPLPDNNTADKIVASPVNVNLPETSTKVSTPIEPETLEVKIEENVEVCVPQNIQEGDKDVPKEEKEKNITKINDNTNAMEITKSSIEDSQIESTEIKVLNENKIDTIEKKVEENVDLEHNQIENEIEIETIQRKESENINSDDLCIKIENNANISEILLEQENSNDSKTSQMNSISEENDLFNEKFIRRKRKRSQVSNSSNIIQTRSTRSQVHTKTEIDSTKEIPVKEDIKNSSKKRSNSFEESSNYTMSEESNDAKPPVVEPSHSDEGVDNKWKKGALAILRSVQNHRNASLLSQPYFDSEAEDYRDAVYRDTDLNSIKKRIENGQIKSNLEFKRDLMLMFINAIIFNDSEPHFAKLVMDMEKETLGLFEPAVDQKIKTREKSQTTEVKNFFRRKTRGSISTDVDTSLKNKSAKRKN